MLISWAFIGRINSVGSEGCANCWVCPHHPRRSASTWRIHAALPGAVEAIRLLHRQGYTLHTASGSCSLELAGSFEGLGVLHCFGRLYGADLVNTFKEGPQYYARLFADAGVQPEEVLVVDDSSDALDWA